MRTTHAAFTFGLARRLASPRCTPLPARFASTQASPSSKKYTDTLLLPKTSFPIRHKDIVKVEQGYRQRVTREYYLRQVGGRSAPQPWTELTVTRCSGRTIPDRCSFSTMVRRTPMETCIWVSRAARDGCFISRLIAPSLDRTRPEQAAQGLHKSLEGSEWLSRPVSLRLAGCS